MLLFAVDSVWAQCRNKSLHATSPGGKNVAFHAPAPRPAHPLLRHPGDGRHSTEDRCHADLAGSRQGDSAVHREDRRFRPALHRRTRPIPAQFGGDARHHLQLPGGGGADRQLVSGCPPPRTRVESDDRTLDGHALDHRTGGRGVQERLRGQPLVVLRGSPSW